MPNLTATPSEAMMTRKLILERDGAVARIVLNQPEAMNAIGPEMARELARAAAFPVSHAAAMRHRDGAIDEGRQREHLRYGSKSILKTGITCIRGAYVNVILVIEDTTARWTRLGISLPAR